MFALVRRYSRTPNVKLSESAVLPQRATSGAAGYDLCRCLMNSVRGLLLLSNWLYSIWHATIVFTLFARFEFLQFFLALSVAQCI